jgi:hypothetical protein
MTSNTFEWQRLFIRITGIQLTVQLVQNSRAYQLLTADRRRIRRATVPKLSRRRRIAVT